MADDQNGKDGGRGRFERGAAYDEVGPGLGRLHDAWDVETGRPALQLLPTDRVDWQPEGPWRVTLLCEPHPAQERVSKNSRDTARRNTRREGERRKGR
ncbi:hypothetical protein D187_005603 [Cystobacter fuscus DSM 2262]|uniref:Uncharacterized protein n=1 Tax=Cystobacter fuscus (strain ATCC 25194 / DSM 2262 / NBRC 100088 / M29) TaxID=1242864 RepID=S9NZC8_CYSF2|nr:hypothetical protein D187_005603 [Cystobacter fuscus DSM 2262]